MSAYDVRSHFAGSTTSSWSSSTGTVYPSVKRLVAAGLVDATAGSGPRKRQLLRLTKSGVAALRAWLDRLPPELASPTADPLRTRVHFLGVLSRDERSGAFEKYRLATAAQIEKLELSLAEPADTVLERSERLGTLGALMELRARSDWLASIQCEVDELGE